MKEEGSETYSKTVYGLSAGREFGSPSAAGTAVTGQACNGWAFWSVGDGGENTGPVRSTKTTPAPRLRAVPKPQAKGRGRKANAEKPPPDDDQGGDEARDDVPPVAEDDGQPVPCAECGETFASVEAATEH